MAMAQINEAVEFLRRYQPTQAQRPIEVRMPWGRYEGSLMSEVPISYLGWVIDNARDLEIRRSARAWLHARTG